MTNALATTGNGEIMERVLMVGDLSKLKPEERVNYYNAVCASIGLNPLTRPFDYITLNGKLTLYTKKDATEQLRNLHGVSITSCDVNFSDDLIVVTVTAQNSAGRTDTDLGVVTLGNLKGDAKANAVMKAITKAKRRVTLSLCGLGWLDETEIETIPPMAVKPVKVTDDGEIVEGEVTATEQKAKSSRPLVAEDTKAVMEKKTANDNGKPPSDKQRKYAVSSLAAVASGDDERHTITNYLFGKLSTNDLTASECSALIDWIDYKEVAPDDWQANPDAIMEALAIIRQDALDKGQGELFPD